MIMLGGFGIRASMLGLLGIRVYSVDGQRSPLPCCIHINQPASTLQFTTYINVHHKVGSRDGTPASRKNTAALTLDRVRGEFGAHRHIRSFSINKLQCGLIR